MQKPAALPGREHRLVGRFLPQLELVAGEVPEWTGEVPLEGADGVRRGAARPRQAAIALVPRRPAPAQGEPGSRRIGQLGGHDGGMDQRLLRRDARLPQRRLPLRGQLQARELLEKHRRRHHRVVLERERRQRYAFAGQAHEVREPRPCGPEAVALDPPAEAREHRRRIEDGPRRPRGPFAVDQADEEELPEPSVGGDARVDQLDAARAGGRGERLRLDPAPHRLHQLGKRGRRVVDGAVGPLQGGEPAGDRGPGPRRARPRRRRAAPDPPDRLPRSAPAQASASRSSAVRPPA